MDSKKRRSSLRKSKSADVVPKDIQTHLKRRISFSGKNSVRVFHGEEEPKTWNNSYEISDHLNSNENVSNICVPLSCKTIQSSLKNTQEIKEIVDKFSTTQQYPANLSISNDNTVLSSSKDLINVLYQNSKLYQIENSVDVTLYEREMKFQMEVGKIGEQTNNLCSFSLEDNEKETHSNKFGEKTIDFMQELRNDTTSIREDVTKTDDFLDEKSVPVSSKYMDEGNFRNPNEAITIYMNDSLSISSNEQISGENKNAANNRRTILQDKTMQLSPSKSKHHNKENVNPYQEQKANQKIIQSRTNTNSDNIEPNIKSRSTINRNEAMEMSPKDTNSLKNTIQSRPISYFTQPIETSLDNNNKKSLYMRSRPTINFNNTIELSPKNEDNNSIYFNQTIKVDYQTVTDGENDKHGVIPKSKSRQTICFHQPIVTSPSTFKATLPKKTVHLSEDIHVSPVQLSQEPEGIFSQPSVCVEKESIAFQEKINRLFFLQESEHDIQERNNTHCENKDSNIKSRSTIYCNVAMEVSPKDKNSLKNTIQFRPTSFFNQPIETSSIYMRSRPTINFNKTIELSPKNPNKISKEDNGLIDNMKPLTSIYINQTIKYDSQTVTDQENNRHGDIPKLNSSPTNCFHQLMETSPSKVNAILHEKKAPLSEDIQVSPVQLSQEPASNNDLNVLLSERKQGQQPKLVTRKICVPRVNIAKSTIDLEQQRMLRYKKKQEQNITSDHAKYNEAVVLEKDKFTKTDKSLNFSLSSSVKNMSLELESSSPLVPSELKVYNLKQLNDEIECGKINVFSNAPKTPSTDQKARFPTSTNIQLTQISTNQRRTQVFDDVDIPISYNDTLNNDLKKTKSNNYFDFNTTQDIKAQEGKNNVKCRYPQADDIMLDNTSFVSRYSSKRELTQSEAIMDIIDESLREADSKKKKYCNDQNNTLGSMYKNTKSIFAQNVTNTKNLNNFMNTMGNSNETITDVDRKILHQRRNVVLNHEVETCHNLSNKKVEPAENNMEEFYNSCAMSNVIDKNDKKNTNLGQKSQTLFLNEDIVNETLSDDASRKILYLENIMPLEKESIGIQQIPLNEENALNNAIDKNDIKNTKQRQKRQTLFLNEDIGDETLSNDSAREILHLENKISLEKESIGIQQIPLNEENALNNAIDKNDIKNTKQRQKRQTLFLNEDIGDETLSNDSARKILHLENKISLEKESIGIQQIPLNEENVLNNAIDKIDIKNTKQRQKRQTLFLNEDIGDETLSNDSAKEILHLENKISLEKESIGIQQIPLNEENVLNNAIDKNDIKNTKQRQKRQTLFLNEDIGDETLSNDSAREILHLENKISLKKMSIEIQQISLDKENSLNNAIDKNDIKNTNLDQKRQTLFLNEDIGDETLSNDSARQILHLENKISLEKESIEIQQISLDKENAFNNAIDKNDIKNTKLRQKRPTLFLNEDIGDETHTDDATRDILYIENKMQVEKQSIGIQQIPLNKENVQAEKTEMSTSKLNRTDTVLYLNNEIPLEQTSIGIDERIQANTCITNKILLEKKSITLEQIPIEVIENKEFKESDESAINPNENGKIQYYNNEISFEMASIINNNNNIQTKEYGTEDCNVKQTRKTLHFYNEACEFGMNKFPLKNSSDALYKDIEDNVFDRGERNLKSNRKTLYFTNDSCELNETLQDKKFCREVSQNSKNEIINQDMEVNRGSGIESKVANNSNNPCLHREQVMDLSLDQYFTPAENEQFPIPAEPLNAAKTSLARQISTNSLSNKLISKKQLSLITPVKCTDSNTNHRLLCITPRLSDLEFSAEEKKSKEDDGLECPLLTESNNKRLPVNLTPVLSIPKKRQTLIFDDCLMNESVISPPNERMSSSKKMESEVDQTRTEKPLYATKRVIGGEEMYISGIVPNESICQTPSKEKKSRIPILISSGKKSKKSFSWVDTSSNNHLETDDPIDMEVDNFGESIQLMRRATTFTHEMNTTIGHNELDAGLLLEGKPFIFEGNPITISDVSTFFEAQRKSYSVSQQTDHLIAVNQINTNAIEKEKISSENRYLNLTLEDIDKTRLSLVRLSYEDSTDDNKHESALEQENNNPEGLPPPNVLDNVIDLKNKLNSVNNLRNASVVCRKCKRCQDTLLNETTSSASGSFVLPELPPVPDLGLARLRRLRKRPTIADVNVLWQRVSLDRTIINAHNISDGDSSVILDLDGGIEKSCAVAKFIQKYEQDKMSFEMHLLEKKQHKSSSEILPFILRLDTLLRTKSTNWIFDHQMQYRGVLVFTHKQMLTFSLELAFEEVDPLGRDISIKSVKLERGHVPEKNWKAIDFVLDFQLKLNLPFDLQSLCKSNNEADVFKMLQIIDNMCLDTVKLGISLQQISFTNHASIIRDECRTYVRKNIRKIITSADSGFKHVEKTEIKVELLNLKKLSFKDIVSPRLYNFREEVHLLPTGLQFLEEFLPNPLNYLKDQ